MTTSIGGGGGIHQQVTPGGAQLPQHPLFTVSSPHDSALISKLARKGRYPSLSSQGVSGSVVDSPQDAHQHLHQHFAVADSPGASGGVGTPAQGSSPSLTLSSPNSAVPYSYPASPTEPTLRMMAYPGFPWSPDQQLEQQQPQLVFSSSCCTCPTCGSLIPIPPPGTLPSSDALPSSKRSSPTTSNPSLKHPVDLDLPGGFHLEASQYPAYTFPWQGPSLAAKGAPQLMGPRSVSMAGGSSKLQLAVEGVLNPEVDPDNDLDSDEVAAPPGSIVSQLRQSLSGAATTGPGASKVGTATAGCASAPTKDVAVAAGAGGVASPGGSSDATLPTAAAFLDDTARLLLNTPSSAGRHSNSGKGAVPPVDVTASPTALPTAEHPPAGHAAGGPADDTADSPPGFQHHTYSVTRFSHGVMEDEGTQPDANGATPQPTRQQPPTVATATAAEDSPLTTPPPGAAGPRAAQMFAGPEFAPVKAALQRHIPVNLLAGVARDLGPTFHQAATAAGGSVDAASGQPGSVSGSSGAHPMIGYPAMQPMATGLAALATASGPMQQQQVVVGYPAALLDSQLQLQGVGLNNGGAVMYPDLRPTARTLQAAFDRAASPAAMAAAAAAAAAAVAAAEPAAAAGDALRYTTPVGLQYLGSAALQAPGPGPGPGEITPAQTLAGAGAAMLGGAVPTHPPASPHHVAHMSRLGSPGAGAGGSSGGSSAPGPGGSMVRDLAPVFDATAPNNMLQPAAARGPRAELDMAAAIPSLMYGGAPPQPLPSARVGTQAAVAASAGGLVLQPLQLQDQQGSAGPSPLATPSGYSLSPTPQPTVGYSHLSVSQAQLLSPASLGSMKHSPAAMLSQVERLKLHLGQLSGLLSTISQQSAHLSSALAAAKVASPAKAPSPLLISATAAATATSHDRAPQQQLHQQEAPLPNPFAAPSTQGAPGPAAAAVAAALLGGGSSAVPAAAVLPAAASQAQAQGHHHERVGSLSSAGSHGGATAAAALATLGPASGPGRLSVNCGTISGGSSTVVVVSSVGGGRDGGASGLLSPCDSLSTPLHHGGVTSPTGAAYAAAASMRKSSSDPDLAKILHAASGSTPGSSFMLQDSDVLEDNTFEISIPEGQQPPQQSQREAAPHPATPHNDTETTTPRDPRDLTKQISNSSSQIHHNHHHHHQPQPQPPTQPLPVGLTRRPSLERRSHGGSSHGGSSQASRALDLVYVPPPGAGGLGMDPDEALHTSGSQSQDELSSGHPIHHHHHHFQPRGIAARRPGDLSSRTLSPASSPAPSPPVSAPAPRPAPASLGTLSGAETTASSVGAAAAVAQPATVLAGGGQHCRSAMEPAASAPAEVPEHQHVAEPQALQPQPAGYSSLRTHLVEALEEALSAARASGGSSKGSGGRGGRGSGTGSGSARHSHSHSQGPAAAREGRRSRRHREEREEGGMSPMIHRFLYGDAEAEGAGPLQQPQQQPQQQQAGEGAEEPRQQQQPAVPQPQPFSTSPERDRDRERDRQRPSHGSSSKHTTPEKSRRSRSSASGLLRSYHSAMLAADLLGSDSGSATPPRPPMLDRGARYRGLSVQTTNLPSTGVAKVAGAAGGAAAGGRRGTSRSSRGSRKSNRSFGSTSYDSECTHTNSFVSDPQIVWLRVHPLDTGALMAGASTSGGAGPSNLGRQPSSRLSSGGSRSKSGTGRQTGRQVSTSRASVADSGSSSSSDDDDDSSYDSDGLSSREDLHSEPDSRVWPSPPISPNVEGFLRSHNLGGEDEDEDDEDNRGDDEDEDDGQHSFSSSYDSDFSEESNLSALSDPLSPARVWPTPPQSPADALHGHQLPNPGERRTTRRSGLGRSGRSRGDGSRGSLGSHGSSARGLHPSSGGQSQGGRSSGGSGGTAGSRGGSRHGGGSAGGSRRHRRHGGDSRRADAGLSHNQRLRMSHQVMVATVLSDSALAAAVAAAPAPTQANGHGPEPSAGAAAAASAPRGVSAAANGHAAAPHMAVATVAAVQILSTQVASGAHSAPSECSMSAEVSVNGCGIPDVQQVSSPSDAPDPDSSSSTSTRERPATQRPTAALPVHPALATVAPVAQSNSLLNQAAAAAATATEGSSSRTRPRLFSPFMAQQALEPELVSGVPSAAGSTKSARSSAGSSPASGSGPLQQLIQDPLASHSSLTKAPKVVIDSSRLLSPLGLRPDADGDGSQLQSSYAQSAGAVNTPANSSLPTSGDEAAVEADDHADPDPDLDFATREISATSLAGGLSPSSTAARSSPSSSIAVAAAKAVAAAAAAGAGVKTVVVEDEGGAGGPGPLTLGVLDLPDQLPLLSPRSSLELQYLKKMSSRVPDYDIPVLIVRAAGGQQGSEPGVQGRLLMDDSSLQALPRTAPVVAATPPGTPVVRSPLTSAADAAATAAAVGLLHQLQTPTPTPVETSPAGSLPGHAAEFMAMASKLREESTQVAVAGAGADLDLDPETQRSESGSSEEDAGYATLGRMQGQVPYVSAREDLSQEEHLKDLGTSTWSASLGSSSSAADAATSARAAADEDLRQLKGALGATLAPLQLRAHSSSNSRGVPGSGADVATSGSLVSGEDDDGEEASTPTLQPSSSSRSLRHNGSDVASPAAATAAALSAAPSHAGASLMTPVPSPAASARPSMVNSSLGSGASAGPGSAGASPGPSPRSSPNPSPRVSATGTRANALLGSAAAATASPSTPITGPVARTRPLYNERRPAHLQIFHDPMSPPAPALSPVSSFGSGQSSPLPSPYSRPPMLRVWSTTSLSSGAPSPTALSAQQQQSAPSFSLRKHLCMVTSVLFGDDEEDEEEQGVSPGAVAGGGDASPQQ